MKTENFFGSAVLPALGEEHFEILTQGSDFHVERIISNGHEDEAGSWYDQDKDEWVILLRGEAVVLLEGGDEVHMKSGDYILIPAHQRHRVLWTSSEPPCYWLGIHGTLKG
jgi:cupin 2 domain-containing protein